MNKLFENIKLSQLFTICNLLANSEVRNLRYIKQKYAEKDIWFEETLLFLENLKILRIDNNILSLSKNYSDFSNSLEQFKKAILLCLFTSNADISWQLRKYLLNFRFCNETIIFKSNEIQKLKYSSIRNLLLELNFINPISDNNAYLINPEYFDLFLEQITRSKLAKVDFNRKQIENEVIGFNAEEAVIKYELKRLTNIPFDKIKIEHVSQSNVYAGYDVKSFENYLDSNFRLINRYIEVKAVSVHDYRFYWSYNEINMAKVFSEQYYLYILPVISNNFDFNKMIMIKDPYKEIYMNNNDWNKQYESICFFKNSKENK